MQFTRASLSSMRFCDPRAPHVSTRHTIVQPSRTTLWGLRCAGNSGPPSHPHPPRRSADDVGRHAHNGSVMRRTTGEHAPSRRHPPTASWLMERMSINPLSLPARARVVASRRCGSSRAVVQRDERRPSPSRDDSAQHVHSRRARWMGVFEHHRHASTHRAPRRAAADAPPSPPPPNRISASFFSVAAAFPPTAHTRPPRKT